MKKNKLFSKERRKEVIKFYGSYTWKKLRKTQLKKHPLCKMCSEEGKVTPASVCDHDDPLWERTWEGFTKGPFSSLCQECHRNKTIEIDIPKMMRAERLAINYF